MLTKSSRTALPLLALIAWALPLSAQRPPLHAGDTVRVWPKGNERPVQDNVVFVGTDSLKLRFNSFAISDISRIEIARGKRPNRARMLKWVAGGLIGGGLVGFTLGQSQGQCPGCAPAWVSFAQIGAEVGAGAGFLLSQRQASDPAWFPIWPLPPRESAIVAEQTARDTTPRQNLEPAYFSNIPRGKRVKAWIGDTALVTGRFAMLSQDRTLMDLLNQPSIPLKSIDVLQVGHGHGAQGALIGAVGLTVPMSLLVALACAWGCDNNRVTTFLVGTAVIGGTIGGVVGANQVTWETRFRR